MAIDLNNGLVGAWSGNVPEYPDNPAGTTYISNWTAGVDGWSAAGSSSSVSVSGNKLIVTAGASGTFMLGQKSIVFTGKSTRVKVSSSVNGTLQLISTIGSDVVLSSIAAVAGREYILDGFNAGSVTIVKANILGSIVAGTTLTLSFFYIGDDTYSSQALDISGNGKHAQIFGATPVEGGFSRDGINDYEVTSASQSMPDIFHYHERWAIPSSANIQFIFGAGATGAARLFFARQAGMNTLVVSYFNGSNVDLNFANYFSAGTENIDADIVVNWTTGAVSVYKNGVLFGTQNMAAGQQKPGTQLWYFGQRAILSANQYGGGLYMYRRIYDRALAADEITALYEDPAAYAIDNVTRATTPVPSSIATRDANGDIQFRRITSTVATGTAPFTVTSTTKVNNLNVDRIDDLDSTDFVRASGTVAQTVGGVKTFSSIPVLPASNPTLANQAARKGYVDSKVPGIITISTLAPTGGTDGDIWIQV